MREQAARVAASSVNAFLCKTNPILFKEIKEAGKPVSTRDFGGGSAPIGANFDILASKAKLPARPLTRKALQILATEISASAHSADDPGNSSPEIEFALVLSRMIDAAYGDPAQLRNSIYELARVKLRKEVLRGEVDNEARLVNALDVAIRNVESFSKREDRNSRFPLLPRSVTAQIANQTASAAPVLLIEHGPTAARPDLAEKPVRSNMRRSILAVVLGIVVAVSVF